MSVHLFKQILEWVGATAACIGIVWLIVIIVIEFSPGWGKWAAEQIDDFAEFARKHPKTLRHCWHFRGWRTDEKQCKYWLSKQDEYVVEKCCQCHKTRERRDK